jgi:PAS domain S-box-containing protein
MSDRSGECVRLGEENERLRRQVEMLEGEVERAKTTLRSIGDAVISVGTDGKIIQMNQVAETLTGWREPEVLGHPLVRIFRIVNEETRDVVESPVERVLREGTVVGLANHTLLIARDGSERPIADSGAPIRNGTGETTGGVLVFRDQTKERRTEKEVRAAEERFKNFFDNAPIGKSMTAPDGRLLRVNQAFGAMVGYSVEEMQTVTFAAITHPDDLPESRECVRALLAGEQDAWTMDKRYVAKDGHHVWTHVTTRLQRDDEGKPLFLLTHIEDITERKRAEEALRILNIELEQRVRDRTAQLEESNRELEAFSFSVSHDLRAPLRAIDGFARILAEEYGGQLDTEGRRLCSVVRENAKSMGQLIDDLLSFSRLGRAQMNLAPIDMRALATTVFHELATPESRTRIDFQIDPLPQAIADPTLMRQVWMNLLSNAIKFSSKLPRASIKVGVRHDQGGNVYVVKDDGAGFEMQYVGKLFGVFQRLHSAKEFEGTGVGLALVHRIIRRHGGRVWAEGEPDQGATFYFTLQGRGA